MKRITGLLLLLALLWTSSISIAGADERIGIETPYSEHGAGIIGALNLFKAVFPDTKPGEEEYH
ncbi:MAG: hypothetical protein QHH75_15415, partial [Bacillota bacterium]|nr:hypothetical protein [Bacillota bacterium]